MLMQQIGVVWDEDARDGKSNRSHRDRAPQLR